MGFIKGRVALYAILRAMGIGAGDEVVVPGFTCVIVAAAIKYTGARPVYYDINPLSLQGDPDLAALAITERTRAVLIQHNYGTPAPFGHLGPICSAKGISIIEDCAHAMGASVGGQPVGLMGDAAFASLQWSKPTTTGLGGIARINRPDLTLKLEQVVGEDFSEPSVIKSIYLGVLSAAYRAWYRPSWYWSAQSVYRWAGKKGLIQGSSSIGELESKTMPIGYRETFGSVRSKSLKMALSDLPRVLGHRRNIHSLYRKYLKNEIAWLPPEEDSDVCGAALRFPMLVENRSELLNAARRSRIEIGDWFNAPLHPAGCPPEVFDYEAGMCPIAEAASSRVINLPTHQHTSPDVAQKTVEFVKVHGEFSKGIEWASQV